MNKVFCSIAALSLVLACGDSSPSGPGQGGGDAAYYPLSVGNQWVYDRSGQMTIAGVQVATINGMNVTEITGKVSHTLGFEVYQQETSMDDTTEFVGETLIVDSTFTTYVRITDEGFYSYVNLTDADSLVFVPFPLTVGATWQFSQDPPMTAEILSLTAEVTVPAGSFDDCLEIRTTWSESGNIVQNDTYFAPNVGRIKNVYMQTYETVVTTVTSELLSYSVD
jgi:hypothetical protein